MNHSIYSADRATHLKIVVVALLAATTVAAVGIAARIASPRAGVHQLEAKIPLIKAGQPVTVSSSGIQVIR